jgi:SNF2 family DNA or RNA helicase
MQYIILYMANFFLKEPFLHQLKAVRTCHDTNVNNFAYLMEMGTGKTITAIMDMMILHHKKDVDNCVIFAPKSVYRNWYKEIIEFVSADKTKYVIHTWDPSLKDPETKANLTDLLEKNSVPLNIFLMNIESISSPKGVKFLEKYLSVQDKNKTMMIVDESTTIKTHNAKRTKSLIKLTKDISYKRILTGTPVTKSPLDIYTQFAFLDPKILGQSNFYAFRARYAKIINRPTSGGRHFPLITGYQRLDELEQKIFSAAFRVKKEECTDLPPKLYTKRFIPMSKEQLVAYESLRRNAMFVFNDKTTTSVNRLSQIVKLHQVCCGFTINDNGEIHDLPNKRYDELLDVLEEIDGKVIIWATYRHNIKTITNKLKEKYNDTKAAAFYGDTENQVRLDLVRDFQSQTSDLTYLVANPKTGGYGITLTASCTVVYFSNNYDLEIRLQSEDRAHRIGQKNKVTYVDFVCQGTVDDKILTALKNKVDIASQVMGDELKEWIT